MGGSHHDLCAKIQVGDPSFLASRRTVILPPGTMAGSEVMLFSSFQQLGQESSFTSRETFFPLRVSDGLRLTWFVSGNWNVVFKRVFCQLTLGRFWGGLRYLWACELRNCQPLKFLLVVCYSLAF